MIDGGLSVDTSYDVFRYHEGALKGFVECYAHVEIQKSGISNQVKILLIFKESGIVYFDINTSETITSRILPAQQGGYVLPKNMSDSTINYGNYTAKSRLNICKKFLRYYDIKT